MKKYDIVWISSKGKRQEPHHQHDGQEGRSSATNKGDHLQAQEGSAFGVQQYSLADHVHEHGGLQTQSHGNGQKLLHPVGPGRRR